MSTLSSRPRRRRSRQRDVVRALLVLALLVERSAARLPDSTALAVYSRQLDRQAGPLDAIRAVSRSTHRVSAGEAEPYGPDDFACRPIGDCMACAADEVSWDPQTVVVLAHAVLDTPPCNVFGNRRPFACTLLRDLGDRDEPGASEWASWEPCTRLVAKERFDFIEFVLCNLAFAVVALGVLFVRQRTVAAKQFGRLVARIGFPVGADGSPMIPVAASHARRDSQAPR